MIAARDVHKSFGEHQVLQGVSVEVSAGETLVIIGGSGSGKSTLLNIVSGIIPPSSGSVHYKGTDITGLDGEALNDFRQEWGFCFQDGALFGSMTVGENVALPIREHTDLSEDVIEIMVKMKLDMVGLTGFRDLHPAELSGGMVKRAALARALALDPEVLFCDEPSSGLDPVMSAAIDQLILDLTEKTQITTVLVTHQMKSAFTVGDHLVLLHEGSIVEEGPPEVFRESSDPLVRQFVEGEPDGPIPLRKNREQFVREMLGEDPER